MERFMQPAVGLLILFILTVFVLPLVAGSAYKAMLDMQPSASVAMVKVIMLFLSKPLVGLAIFLLMVVWLLQSLIKR